eukprot:3719898-Amphidinium_carterae.1
MPPGSVALVVRLQLRTYRISMFGLARSLPTKGLIEFEYIRTSHSATKHLNTIASSVTSPSK